MSTPVRAEFPPTRSFVDVVHCVGRRTELSEYPLLCRLFVRFILWPAKIFSKKRPARLANYALFRWKYSEIHLQNACTDYDCAVRESSCPGGFHIALPVDSPLPLKAVVFDKHGFPQSGANSRYLARLPDIEQVERAQVEGLENRLRKLGQTLGDV